jgi:uncharacterized protein YndB with AHSA1/START domain
MRRKEMSERQSGQAGTLEPVRKQVEVGLPLEAAFQLFTEGIGRWWPLATHSVGQEQAETCFFEGRVGGRIVEVKKDGSRAEWGRVVAWEPPHRITFQWYPGRSPDTAQEVTVTFSEGRGGTLVTLVHTGWERLGAQAQAQWDNYNTGWDHVLGNYISLAEKRSE